jgi:AcrR family transcriptional regulator
MPKISASARRALTEERRKQILDAAAKVFAAKGFDRATIADIAREAGIAEGSIYNYFKNKGDLLVSIPRQVIQPQAELVWGQMRAAADAPIPPEQMLPIIVKNITTIFHQNRHVFRILISALPAMSQSTREQYVNRVIFYVWSYLETYFRQLIEKGILRKDLDPAILTRMFVGMFLPFLLLDAIVPMKNKLEFDMDQVSAQAIGIFLGGALAGKDVSSDRPIKRVSKIAIE